MELSNINNIEKATRKAQRELFRFGIALLFIIAVMFYTGHKGAEASCLSSPQ